MQSLNSDDVVVVGSSLSAGGLDSREIVRTIHDATLLVAANTMPMSAAH